MCERRIHTYSFVCYSIYSQMFLPFTQKFSCRCRILLFTLVRLFHISNVYYIIFGSHRVHDKISWLFNTSRSPLFLLWFLLTRKVTICMTFLANFELHFITETVFCGIYFDVNRLSLKFRDIRGIKIILSY